MTMQLPEPFSLRRTIIGGEHSDIPVAVLIGGGGDRLNGKNQIDLFSLEIFSSLSK